MARNTCARLSVPPTPFSRLIRSFVVSVTFTVPSGFAGSGVVMLARVYCPMCDISVVTYVELVIAPYAAEFEDPFTNSVRNTKLLAKAALLAFDSAAVAPANQDSAGENSAY